MFKVLWSKTVQGVRGLPRPYSLVPYPARKRVAEKGMKIAKKVPIPWQSFSKFEEGSFVGVIKEHEQEVVDKGVCAYCGLGFNPEDLAIIWINYPKKNPTQTIDRVFSDHFPFHLSCMDETRKMCPYMHLTKDEEFEVGKYCDLLLKAKGYYTSITSI
jgi:hypothetical protein